MYYSEEAKAKIEAGTKAEYKRNTIFIKEVLDNLGFVDFESREGVSLNDLTSDPHKEKRSYADKPAGFKYELSQRSNSAIPSEIKKEFENFENEKVSLEYGRGKYKNQSEKTTELFKSDSKALVYVEMLKALTERSDLIIENQSLVNTLVEDLQRNIKPLGKVASVDDELNNSEYKGPEHYAEALELKHGGIKKSALMSMVGTVNRSLGLHKPENDAEMEKLILALEQESTPYERGEKREVKNNYKLK